MVYQAFKDSLELEQELVCAKFAHTAEDGKTYNTAFFTEKNLVMQFDFEEEEQNNIHPRDNTSSGNRTAVSGSSLGASLGFQATTKRTEADFTS